MDSEIEAIDIKKFVEHRLKPLRDAEAKQRKLICILFGIWIILFGGLIIYLIW